MTVATPTAVPPLVYARPWTKGRAVAAAYMLCLGLGIVSVRPDVPGAGIARGVTLALLGALTSWAFLGLRTRVLFTATGVVDVGCLRATSLSWEEVTCCTVVEQTLRPPRSPAIHGVLIRFVSLRTDPTRVGGHRRPHDRAIEVFVPDRRPMSPAIAALLTSIPQLRHAPWALLESSARRRN